MTKRLNLFQRFCWLLLFAFFSSHCLAADDAESEIEPVPLWVDFDVAAFEIGKLSSSHSTQLALLKIILPKVQADYPVYLDKANTGRAESLLANNQRGCISNLRKTESRSQKFYFSEPLSLYFGLKLFYRGDNPKAVDAVKRASSGRVDLEKLLLTQGAGRLGVVAGRAYGAQVDALLANPEMRYNLYVRGANDMSKSLLEMLVQGRIDYVLDFPEVVAYYTPDHLAELKSVSIKQGEAMVTGHIACTKNPEGKLLVDAFNHAIESSRTEPAYLQAHIQGLPASLVKAFTRQFNRVFIEGKNNGS
jgi:uncharacterized protein (TIGR02285 family)